MRTRRHWGEPASRRSPLLLRLSTHSWAWSFPLWGRGTGRAPRPQEIPARRAGRAARVCYAGRVRVCRARPGRGPVSTRPTPGRGRAPGTASPGRAADAGSVGRVGAGRPRAGTGGREGGAGCRHPERGEQRARRAWGGRRCTGAATATAEGAGARPAVTGLARRPRRPAGRTRHLPTPSRCLTVMQGLGRTVSEAQQRRGWTQDQGEGECQRGRRSQMPRCQKGGHLESWFRGL